ncbi:MAG: polynucleotide adenylyltransferase PcnB [Francisellaceae bacterium]|jgi:poly(A) polymerase|nr:polynucleotide adenylyltransferase PcnB [Francisellaceae bacterium]
MLSKLVNGFKSFIKRGNSNKPIVVPRAQHSVSRANISPNALKVLYRLKKKGYKAYLVGGGIRDVLLGITPKDFDVATDARPWEIKRLFANCRLIGKRFRLAHIYFYDETIEVATFRAGDLESNQIVTRDNVYGTLDDDVWRRDFTVNALYYSIVDFSIVDYVDGMKDMKNKLIRVIGVPRQRYHEDPVRMIRAIRFAAKLNFTIEKKSATAITECRDLLKDISSARLFEEFKKLFLTGCGQGVFTIMMDYGFVEIMFPETHKFLEDPVHKGFILSALAETDDRVAHAKSLNPAFVFAILLWPRLIKEVESLRGHNTFEKLRKAMLLVIDKQRPIIAISKHLVMTICDIWHLQFQLRKPSPRNVAKLFAHPKFRAAYDFMYISYQHYQTQDKMLNWWQSYMDADENQRWAMLKSLKGSPRYYNGNRDESTDDSEHE